MQCCFSLYVNIYRNIYILKEGNPFWLPFWGYCTPEKQTNQILKFNSVYKCYTILCNTNYNQQVTVKAKTFTGNVLPVVGSGQKHGYKRNLSENMLLQVLCVPAGSLFSWLYKWKCRHNNSTYLCYMEFLSIGTCIEISQNSDHYTILYSRLNNIMAPEFKPRLEP